MGGHDGSDRCEENAFCRSLDEKTRCELCAFCVKSTYAAGSSVRANQDRVLLVLEGLCCIETRGGILAVLGRGDLFPFPSRMIGPAREAYRQIVEEAVSERVSGPLKLVAVTDVTCASFELESVVHFLADPVFCSLIYANMFVLLQKSLSYGIEVRQSDAYHAVRFALRVGRVQGIEGLTHAQIAHLTGLGRSTVTKVMHEVALKEPELLS